MYSSSSNTVAVGVGNTILSDDGVGVHALHLLESDSRIPPGVVFLDGGTLGLSLLPCLSDVARVLFLDAVDTGQPPGTLTRLTGDGLLGGTAKLTVHQIGVVDLIATLAFVASVSQEIVVLGVQPASTDWGTTLSTQVEAVLGQLVEMAVEQLQRWSGLKATTLAYRSLEARSTASCEERSFLTCAWRSRERL